MMETDERFDAMTELIRECWKTAEDHGWHAAVEMPDEVNADGSPVVRKMTLGERVALLHSEASELLEAYRDRQPPIWMDESGKPEGPCVELADVIIRAFDMSFEQNWNLPRAIQMKMQYNESRPYRHGGKVI